MRSALRYALALAALIASRATAQPPAPMPCDVARETLLADSAERTAVLIASRRIVRCGDVAPPVLATVLRQAQIGSLRDTVAREAAWYLSDRRMLDTAIAMSVDRQVGVTRRTVALWLLTHYADSLASLLPGSQHDGMPIVIAHRIHGGYVPGNDPLRSEDQDRALDAIRRVAREEPDPDLRLLAKLAAEQLQMRRSYR